MLSASHCEELGTVTMCARLEREAVAELHRIMPCGPSGKAIGIGAYISRLILAEQARREERQRWAMEMGK